MNTSVNHKLLKTGQTIWLTNFKSYGFTGGVMLVCAHVVTPVNKINKPHHVSAEKVKMLIKMGWNVFSTKGRAVRWLRLNMPRDEIKVVGYER